MGSPVGSADHSVSATVELREICWSAGVPTCGPPVGNSSCSGVGCGTYPDAGRTARRRAGQRCAARFERPRALHKPRAELAGFQPACSRPSARRHPSTAGAGQVPRDRVLEPGRVLHGPRCLAPPEAARGRHRSNVDRRHDRPGAAGGDTPASCRDAEGFDGLLENAAPAGPGRRGRPLSRSAGIHRRDPSVPGRVLPFRDLFAADAAGLRPRPSVPVHLASQQELRGGGASAAAHALRARQDPAAHCRASCPSRPARPDGRRPRSSSRFSRT